MMDASPITKICCKCGERHDLAFFNNDCTREDGKYPQCKNCSRSSCRRVYRKYHDKHVELKRRWKAANMDRCVAVNREWRRENPEKARGYVQAWREKNPEEVRRLVKEYRLRKRQATPSWVDKGAIRDFYRNRPEGHHVDHIVPLGGANVCGLNVPWNLQYLPAAEHQRKGVEVPKSWSNELV